MLRMDHQYKFLGVFRALLAISALATMPLSHTNAATIDCTSSMYRLYCEVINDDQYGAISNVDFYGLSGDIGTGTHLLVEYYELPGFWIPNYSYVYAITSGEISADMNEQIIADINSTGHFSTRSTLSFAPIQNGHSKLFTITFNQIIEGLPLTLHDAQVWNTAEGPLNSQYLAPSAVPVPAAMWLLGSGLMGLIGVARLKRV